MAFPTGLRESSGLLIEKTVPAEVMVGQKFDYVYKVSNLTDYPIHMVTLSDRVSPNFTPADADPKPADTRDGVATWQVGTLGPKRARPSTSRAPAPKKAPSALAVGRPTARCCVRTSKSLRPICSW